MAIPDTNPNEYDDGKYLQASMKLLDVLLEATPLHDALEGLWRAGGTRGDIESEWENVLDDALEEAIGYTDMSGREPKPKPKRSA